MDLFQHIKPGVELEIDVTYPGYYSFKPYREKLTYWFVRGGFALFNVVQYPGMKPRHRMIAISVLNQMQAHPEGGWTGFFDKDEWELGEPQEAILEPTRVRLWVTKHAEEGPDYERTGPVGGEPARMGHERPGTGHSDPVGDPQGL